MSSSPQILLTGATGFIGGSILHHLATSPSLSSATITCLIRDPSGSRSSALTSKYGSRVRTLPYADLDDTPAIISAASQADIAINTTNGYHASSSAALVQGLAKRKSTNGGRDVWMIHTSGTSNFADQPISKTYLDPVAGAEGREFDDAKHDLYAYEKEREALHAYPQRTAELGVIDAGVELGVKTLVISSPTIFGVGTGLFNNISIQIPAYVNTILNHGRSVVVGEGKGVWDYVHVEDLADLYALAVQDIVEKGGKNLPSGKKGIMYSANGRFSWMDVAKGVAEACVKEGKLKSAEVEKVSLKDAAEIFEILGMKGEELVELGLSSNSKTNSTTARRLGWKPTRGVEAWKKGFEDDVKGVIAKA